MSSGSRTPAAPGLVLLALASGAFAIGATQGGAGSIVVEQAAGLGTGVDSVGYSMAAYAFGVAVSAPLLTVALARWDRRRILLAMMAVAVVMSTATALAPTVESLTVIRFFAAIPHGVFLGAGSVVGAHVLGAKRRGRAMALMMTGFTVAIIVALPLMKWAAAHLGWRWSYGGVAAASALAFLLVWLFVPSVPPGRVTSWRRDAAHLKGPMVWAAIAFCAVGFVGISGLFAYVVPLLQDVDHLSVNQISIVLALAGISMTVGTLIAGRVTDKSPVRAARIGALISVVALVSLGAGGTIPLVAVAVVMTVNFATALMSQGAQTHFMDVVDASPMLGAAMSHAALNIANALGAALGAIAVAAGLGYLSMAWFAVAFTLIGAAILVVAPGFRTVRRAALAAAD